ncbi:NAD(P)/FAD-dependent oxidoreductase [Alicyclobacillus fodiniaquatilis]|uniref:NAD(P)/FAD-dependent oxidoreductase n=1 Tax=Alicyclobacillus fodiniaquatilis TaxID=1661150 RepID=A0ABW4JQ47_9BACL
MDSQNSDVLTTDVIVIGGGPAGLSAALVLGRARRSVAVIDEGKPRNRVTHESHGFLTRDSISPNDFHQIAKEQILKYPSVSFESDVVSSVSGSDEKFSVAMESGRIIYSRKILFATGMKDVLPDIKGLTEVYGRSAFVCPFCDGWELRDRHISVIGTNKMGLHLVKMVSGWTKHITFLTNGSQFLATEDLIDLERHHVETCQDSIKQIDSIEGMVQRIIFKSDTTIDCEGIFFVPKLVQATPIPASLGCKMTDDNPFSTISTDPLGRTNVVGVYSAGDAATQSHQLIQAASSGAMAAAAIQLDLLDTEWSKAR